MTAAEGRPPLPKLSRGDLLIVRSGRDRAYEARVAIAGRKYVHVIDAGRFETYNPDTDAWRLRKFLLADQAEGERGTRVGAAATIATPEQHAYDAKAGSAARYLREQGIEIARRSPWAGREIELANLLKFVTAAPPAAGDE